MKNASALSIVKSPFDFMDAHIALFGNSIQPQLQKQLSQKCRLESLRAVSAIPRFGEVVETYDAIIVLPSKSLSRLKLVRVKKGLGIASKP